MKGKLALLLSWNKYFCAGQLFELNSQDLLPLPAEFVSFFTPQYSTAQPSKMHRKQRQAFCKLPDILD